MVWAVCPWIGLSMISVKRESELPVFLYFITNCTLFVSLLVSLQIIEIISDALLAVSTLFKILVQIEGCYPLLILIYLACLIAAHTEHFTFSTGSIATSLSHTTFIG